VWSSGPEVARALPMRVATESRTLKSPGWLHSYAGKVGLSLGASARQIRVR
jgi:hypothetical protein